MVALHELKIKLLVAQGADVPLLLPNFHLDVIGERPQVKVALIARQNIRDDVFLFVKVVVRVVV